MTPLPPRSEVGGEVGGCHPPGDTLTLLGAGPPCPQRSWWPVLQGRAWSWGSLLWGNGGVAMEPNVLPGPPTVHGQVGCCALWGALCQDYHG